MMWIVGRHSGQFSDADAAYGSLNINQPIEDVTTLETHLNLPNSKINEVKNFLIILITDIAKSTKA